MVFCEFRPSKVHCPLEVFHFNSFSDLPRCCNSFDEGVSNDFVFYYGDELGGGFGCCFKNSFNSFNALESRELPIVRAGSTASLNMSECSNPSIQFEFVGEKVFYFGRGDFVQLHVMSTLRDYDDCFPFAKFSML